MNNQATPKVSPYELVPIKDKLLLTIKEAALYSGIGEGRLYKLVDVPTCEFVVRIGSKWTNKVFIKYAVVNVEIRLKI